ncbi:MAG TPA: LPD38 domain-containing protein [Acidiferrobacterales bacterium]|nr:LPD38 domain-containing protein [Acidiferrobacterales bacterium]
MGGVQDLQRLRDAGFSSEEVADYEVKQRVQLRDAGFAQEEVDKHFGTQSANMKAAEQYFTDVARTVQADAEPATPGGPRKAVGFKDYLEAGWQIGNVGMAERGALPDVTAEDAPWYGRATANLATLAGDAPAMLVGATVGAVGGTLVAPGIGTVIGAGGGGMALPMALRESLIQNIKNGAIKDPQDFLDRALAVSWEGGKGFVIGAATMGAGKVAGALPIASPLAKTTAQLGAELTTMTTVGHALEGKLPSAQDFLDGAVLLGGLKGAVHVSGKLMEVYTKTGKLPHEIVADAAADATIKQSILSSNEEIPTAYKDLVQGAIKEAEPKPEKPTRDLTGRSDAEQAVLARIAGEQKKPGYSWDKFYTEFVNDLHPIFKAVEELGGKELPAAEHAGKLAQLTRGSVGKADQALEYGTYDPVTLKNTGEGLKDRMRPVAENLDGWRAYALAKRAVELEGKGIETGIPLADAKRVIADAKKNNPEFEVVNKKVGEYQNWLVDNLAESGILSKEAAAAMKEAHKDYVPFYRLMDEAGQGRGIGVGLRVRDPIKGIKGSERQILDPLESIIKNTYSYMQLADRNMVGRALVELAEKHPRGAEMLQPIPQKLSKVTISEAEINKFLKEQGIDDTVGDALSVFRHGGFTPRPDQIVVFRNGVKEVYQVSRDLADAFNKTDRFTASMVVKMMSIPASTLRAGAVLSPDFMARNLSRDQLSAFVNSSHGFTMITDALRGMQEIIGKGEAYQNWLKSGGANAAMVNIDRAYISKNIFKLDEQTGFIGKAINVVKTPIEALRVVSELMENSTRLGEFMKASKAGDRQAILEGGFASREVTLDFARVGAKTRAMNQITAFWNAHVQGTDRTIRRFGEDPMGTTAKVAAAITAPSILLWWANKDDPRYKQLPDWQKDLFWIVLTDDHVYRIPKPFELGLIFGTLPERALDAVYRQDPKAFDGMAETILKQLAPEMVPTVAQPILEQWANKSTLTGNALIPAGLEGLLPQYQATPYTTEAAKALGKMIGAVPGLHESQAASPILAENYLRAWTGGLGMYALQIVDFGLRKAHVLPDPVKPADTLADIPFVKAFVVRYPSAGAQPIQTFYDRYERNAKILKTVKYLAAQGDVDAMQAEMEYAPDALLQLSGTREALSTMSQVVRGVYADPNMTADDKRQLIDATYYQMIEITELSNKLMDEVEKTVPKKFLQD